MQFVKILSALLLLVALISSLCYSQVDKAMPREDRVQKKLAAMSSVDGPGIQYVIVDKAGIVHEESSGLADVENRIPLSLGHSMAAFSMTKTLTAIAVLQLAEQGKIDLDEPASAYVEHPYDQKITIRQLLSHTSGIPNPIPLRWVHTAKEHPRFNERSALEKVLATHRMMDGRPGEKYSYSNINYWLLGGVVEAVSGKNFAAYVRKNIFEPLQLPPDEIDLIYSENAPRAKGYLAKYSFMNLAKGFVTDKAVWGDYEGNWLHVHDVYVNGPAFGGAIGTARAFGIILQDLLAERSVLLGEKGRELLFARQKTADGKEIDMTLGWHIAELDGKQYYFKEGGGAGFHSEMRMYPAQGLASVIMTNQTSFNSRKALNKLDIQFLKN